MPNILLRSDVSPIVVLFLWKFYFVQTFLQLYVHFVYNIYFVQAFSTIVALLVYQLFFVHTYLKL